MWHDLGTTVGWTGWLLMALVTIAFWAVVVVCLWVLFRFSWTTDRRKQGGTPSSDGRPAKPGQRR
jgi:hypothetical protein